MNIVGVIVNNQGIALCPSCLNLLLTAYTAYHYTTPIYDTEETDHDITCHSSICGHSVILAANIEIDTATYSVVVYLENEKALHDALWAYRIQESTSHEYGIKGVTKIRIVKSYNLSDDSNFLDVVRELKQKKVILDYMKMD